MRQKLENQTKFDPALDKLRNINESKQNEFTAFYVSIEHQLQKLPDEAVNPLINRHHIPSLEYH